MQCPTGGYRLGGVVISMGAWIKTMARQSDDQYSEQEAQQRFEKLVKAALNTRPRPLKSMGPKGVSAQSKKRKKRTKNSASSYSSPSSSASAKTASPRS
jgi:Sec-independent protein translocase protein TatA